MREHTLLGLLVLIEAVVSLGFLAWLVRTARGTQDRLDAALQGQEHIAELTAEVLRRTPPRGGEQG